MNLHEYQAKQLLLDFDLPILSSKFYINNLNNIEKDLKKLNGPPWVVKSQIHAGGRGAGFFKNSVNNKGGVQIAKDIDQTVALANAMMTNKLITKQTGEEGKIVNRILIEESCNIKKEFYLSLIIDRNTSKLMLMISSAGGVDIEEVAEKHPNKIHTFLFENFNEIILNEKLYEQLEITSNQYEELKSIIKKLALAFKSLDASTIEINPMVLNEKGKFVLLDAKITIDDNALFRQPNIANLKDISEENPLELQASINGMNYVKLQGSIGCMVNGAGLAMATMDMFKLFGHEPANFLDLGGTANKERAIQGFKIIQSDANVKSVLINIFGGIIQCDMIANGIAEALKELKGKGSYSRKKVQVSA